MIIPDMQCSMWPDIWFGFSLTQCCILHDLGGSDLDLLMCVADLSPMLIPIGIIMFIGVKLLRPLYLLFKKDTTE